MRDFWILFGAIAVAVLFVLCVYSTVIYIVDFYMEDMPVDDLTPYLIEECPKLKAVVDALTERVYALEQARREAKGGD